MRTSQGTLTASGADGIRQHVLQRYEQSLAYYVRMSQYNKRLYKVTRYLVVFLGAFVTMVSSMSSADFVKVRGGLAVAFAVLTPVLAASLAIVGGISQSFQWGAAWSDMVITAARLEKERDRIAVTAPEQLDPIKELGLLDDLVLSETQGFLQRLFGSGGPGKSEPNAVAG
jgi:hypothetical protein